MNFLSGLRTYLHENWAMWRNLFRLQPLEEIKEYFGEKVALYFSFIGFYTSSLLPFSILGLAVMFFGLATYSDDTFVQQSCNLNLSLWHGFKNILLSLTVIITSRAPSNLKISSINLNFDLFRFWLFLYRFYTKIFLTNHK